MLRLLSVLWLAWLSLAHALTSEPSDQSQNTSYAPSQSSATIPKPTPQRVRKDHIIVDFLEFREDIDGGNGMGALFGLLLNPKFKQQVLDHPDDPVEGGALFQHNKNVSAAIAEVWPRPPNMVYSNTMAQETTKILINFFDDMRPVTPGEKHRHWEMWNTRYNVLYQKGNETIKMAIGTIFGDYDDGNVTFSA